MKGLSAVNIWDKAQNVQLQVSDGIKPCFDIGFDKGIPQETADELRRFVSWVEDNYSIPVTLWVDFEYKHYLVRKNGQRAGFIFYWSDIPEYPVFNDPKDIPIIRLPARTEHCTMEEILASFIEAVSMYYAWICNEITDGYKVNESDVEEILQSYLISR